MEIGNALPLLSAVNVSIQYNTTIVPVVNVDNDYAGAITADGLLKWLGTFNGADEIGGLIVLEMERSQFAISEISRIVESNNCTILHLNTTVHPLTGILTVTLHINNKEIAAIVTTFERYDYEVIYQFGTQKFESEIDSNFKNLMAYLNV